MSGEKIMVVTGGSRGIGAAIARLAAKQGYDVAINYVGNEAAAREVVADIEKAGRRAIAVKGNMGEPRDIANLFTEVDKKLGRVTHLVNNAGIMGTPNRVADIDAAKLKEVVDVNVTGAILVAGEAVRRMSTKHGGKGGAIVNIASISGMRGNPGRAAYGASKGGVINLTRQLAVDYGPLGVRVNAVCPGYIDNDMDQRRTRMTPEAAAANLAAREAAAALQPLGRQAQTEEVAAAVAFLASADASFMTGAIVPVDGGCTAHFNLGSR